MLKRLLLAGLCAAIALGARSGFSADPLKVFVLVGQSNMQGHAQVRTLEHIGMDPDSAPIFNKLVDEGGTPRVADDVWISYLSAGGVRKGKLTAGFGAAENKIGPEFSFGFHMRESLGEPILIIKAAWGGKSLNTDFRPPSAGAYEFSTEQLERFEQQGKDIAKIKADKAEATGHYYRLMLEHVRNVLGSIDEVVPNYDSAAGYKLSGFVWFQGWNDMVDRGTYPTRDQPGGYDAYAEVMAHFIRDVRKELGEPELPFVIGVLGVNGPTAKYGPEQQRYKSVHQNFRDAMEAAALLNEFKDNVAAVKTEDFWDLELSALRKREAALKQAAKKKRNEEKLSRAQESELLAKMKAEEFTRVEIETLEKGVSNAEYHYLGSAKIMAKIGKGFADALTTIKN